MKPSIIRLFAIVPALALCGCVTGSFVGANNLAKRDYDRKKIDEAEYHRRVAENCYRHLRKARPVNADAIRARYLAGAITLRQYAQELLASYMEVLQERQRRENRMLLKE